MAMLPTLLVAAACAGWHADVAGHYDGWVQSTNLMTVETWIEVTPEGRLSGRYVLHETGRDVPGTLDSATDGDCQESWFRWTDQYGTGTVRLQFYPDRHCFEGVWGSNTDLPTLPWTTCDKPPQVSRRSLPGAGPG